MSSPLIGTLVAYGGGILVGFLMLVLVFVYFAWAWRTLIRSAEEDELDWRRKLKLALATIAWLFLVAILSDSLGLTSFFKPAYENPVATEPGSGNR